MKSPVTLWRKQKKDIRIIGHEGTIITWTRIVVSPPKFQTFTPYIVVLVELSNKEKVYGQLVDYEEKDLVIDRKVKATLRKSGTVGAQEVIEYGVKFKPL